MHEDTVYSKNIASLIVDGLPFRAFSCKCLDLLIETSNWPNFICACTQLIITFIKTLQKQIVETS